MFNRIVLGIATLMITISHHHLASELPNPLPEQFYVNERWLSWTTDFDIETDQYKFGYIHRKFLSWTFEYEFHDIYDHLEATGKARFFSWGLTFDVIDNKGQPLGIVQEKVLTFFPTFELISPEGKILAKATMNFWGTKFVLTDPVTDEILVTLRRPFLRLRNCWSVCFDNSLLFYQKQIDPRLFILLVAFQVDLEHLIAMQQHHEQIHHHNYSLTEPNMKFSNKIEVKELRVALEQQIGSFNFVDPTEDDFTKVEMHVEAILKAAGKEEDEQSRMAGLRHILTLLSRKELSPGEKSALYQMMKKSINDLYEHLEAGKNPHL